MRDLFGNNNLHLRDTATQVNPDILNAVMLAKLTKDPGDFIDCLYGGKTLEDVNGPKETRIVEDFESER